MGEVVVIFALLLLGGLHLWASVRMFDDVLERRRASRLVAGTPAGQRVSVTGVCRAGSEPLRAPVSRQECAWWSWSLQNKKGAITGAWVERAGASSADPFVVDDATIRTRVDPRGARGDARSTTLDPVALGSLTRDQLERGPEVDVRELSPRSRTTHDDGVPGDVPLTNLAGRGASWRIVETVVPVDTDVWVCGTTEALVPPEDGVLVRGVEGFPLLIVGGEPSHGVRRLVGRPERFAASGVVLWGLGAFFAGVQVESPRVLAALLLALLVPAGVALLRWRRAPRSW